MLQVLTIRIVLLLGHLFIADRAHVMIETVVDVGAIRVLQTLFQCFPGGLRCVFSCHILDSLRFVKDTSVTLDTMILTQLSEPA